MDWKAEFTDRVLKNAGDHPDVFLALLCARAEHHPEAIPMFAEAMQDMGDWCNAQAKALNDILDLRRSQAAEVQS